MRSVPPDTPPPLRFLFLPISFFVPAAIAGTGHNKAGDKKEVARLVDTLALGTVGTSTQRQYLGKWNTWVAERRAQGKGPCLRYSPDNPNQVLFELTEFMTCL